MPRTMRASCAVSRANERTRSKHKMEGWRIYGGGGGRIYEREPTHAGQDNLSGEPDAQENPVATPEDNPYTGEMVQWVGYPGCGICQANMAIGPVPYGTMFPSGQTEPPAHEHCNCDLEIVDESNTPGAPTRQTPNLPPFGGWLPAPIPPVIIP